MTGTINDLMDENARLKTKVEELEAALKERLRFMTEHFEQNGKELGRACGRIDKLEARWKKLMETIQKERDTFEKKPGNAAGIWESGYGQGLANALMFLKDLEQ